MLLHIALFHAFLWLSNIPAVVSLACCQGLGRMGPKKGERVVISYGSLAERALDQTSARADNSLTLSALLPPSGHCPQLQSLRALLCLQVLILVNKKCSASFYHGSWD